MPARAQLDRAAELLGTATSVALACHVNPDADALGSMLGLANFLHTRGVEDGVLVPERAPRAASMGRPAAGSDRLVQVKDFPKRARA